MILLLKTGQAPENQENMISVGLTEILTCMIPMFAEAALQETGI